MTDKTGSPKPERAVAAAAGARMSPPMFPHLPPGRSKAHAAAVRARFRDPEIAYEQSPRRMLRGKLEGEKIKRITQSLQHAPFLCVSKIFPKRFLFFSNARTCTQQSM
jgi:hypothetical protein